MLVSNHGLSEGLLVTDGASYLPRRLHLSQLNASTSRLHRYRNLISLSSRCPRVTNHALAFTFHCRILRNRILSDPMSWACYTRARAGAARPIAARISISALASRRRRCGNRGASSTILAGLADPVRRTGLQHELGPASGVYVSRDWQRVELDIVGSRRPTSHPFFYGVTVAKDTDDRLASLVAGVRTTSTRR